ncbi:MAG: DUF1800 family protein [Planctomycetota bacterium]
MAYRRRIKCPVEFALGIIKGLEAVVSTTQLAQDLANLGQNLYHLPTAKGWIGGRHWINSATMVGRHNLALTLLQGSGPYGDKLNPWTVAKKHGRSTPQSTARFLLDLFLQGDLESNVRDTLPKIARASSVAGGGDSSEPVRHFAHAIVTLPEFQLA